MRVFTCFIFSDDLARLELRTFLRLWLERIPTFGPDPKQPPVFFGGLNLAVRHLPLVW
jgi:cytochrome P450